MQRIEQFGVLVVLLVFVGCSETSSDDGPSGAAPDVQADSGGDAASGEFGVPIALVPGQFTTLAHGVTLGLVDPGRVGAPASVTVRCCETPDVPLRSKWTSLSEVIHVDVADGIDAESEQGGLVLGFDVPDGVDTGHLALAVLSNVDDPLDFAPESPGATIPDDLVFVQSWDSVRGLYDEGSNRFLTAWRSVPAGTLTVQLVTGSDLVSPTNPTELDGTARSALSVTGFELTCVDFDGLGHLYVAASEAACAPEDRLEVPASTCSAAVRQELETLLTERLQALETLGFAAPLLSTAPAYLNITDALEIIYESRYRGELMPMRCAVGSKAERCQDIDGVGRITGQYRRSAQMIYICLYEDGVTDKVRSTAVHELFHAAQYAYPATLARRSDWGIEGMATASESSFAGLARDSSRDPQDLTRSLFENQGFIEYRSQDFWLWEAERSTRGVVRWREILQNGLYLGDISDSLVDDLVPGGLGEALVRYARQYIVEHVASVPGDPNPACDSAGRPEALTVAVDASEQVDLEPLSARLFVVSSVDPVALTLSGTVASEDVWVGYYPPGGVGQSCGLTNPTVEDGAFEISIPPAALASGDARVLVVNRSFDAVHAVSLDVTATRTVVISHQSAWHELGDPPMLTATTTPPGVPVSWTYSLDAQTWLDGGTSLDGEAHALPALPCQGVLVRATVGTGADAFVDSTALSCSASTLTERACPRAAVGYSGSLVGDSTWQGPVDGDVVLGDNAAGDGLVALVTFDLTGAEFDHAAELDKAILRVRSTTSGFVGQFGSVQVLPVVWSGPLDGLSDYSFGNEVELLTPGFQDFQAVTTGSGTVDVDVTEVVRRALYRPDTDRVAQLALRFSTPSNSNGTADQLLIAVPSTCSGTVGTSLELSFASCCPPDCVGCPDTCLPCGLGMVSFGDCCASGTGDGCNDAACMACVCGEDSTCCWSTDEGIVWDSICKSKAHNACGSVCSCCEPDCAGKTCGDDGCGGVCGECPDGATCNADGLCTLQDLDSDGVTDDVDNCKVYNPDQTDTDSDGEGDVCDADDDGDGVVDGEDNCPLDAGTQSDNDADGAGDVCDPDDDNDGVLDADDNCPKKANTDQKDTDDDGEGDACDVVLPCSPPMSCDGADNDCDGFTDEADEQDCLPGEHCLAGECKLPIDGCTDDGDCEDFNACTDDACVVDGFVSECVNTVLTAAPCTDGDACTENDACSSDAECVGEPKDCTDGTSCTSDACVDGQCVYAPVPGCCEADCDGKSCGDDGCGGSCGDCSDGDACTTDTCDAGSCSFAAIPGCTCTPDCDGKSCGDDGCGGSCGACDDDDWCTVDTCAGGQCSYEYDPSCADCTNLPEGNPCGDGDACTEADMCLGGSCVGFQTTCDDEDPCTTDTCDPASGCQHTTIPGCGCDGKADDTPCDDLSACTHGDVCQAGVCVGTLDCDDEDPCTADLCSDVTKACVHQLVEPCNFCTGKPPGTPCPDSHVCTVDETCIDGTCSVTFLPDGTPCDDGSVCTENTTCQSDEVWISCKGDQLSCDDGDACTIDSCDPALGCQYEPVSCPQGEACEAGQCVGQTPNQCAQYAQCCGAQLTCPSSCETQYGSDAKQSFDAWWDCVVDQCFLQGLSTACIDDANSGDCATPYDACFGP